jgi:hypothetical protein
MLLSAVKMFRTGIWYTKSLNGNSSDPLCKAPSRGG